MCAAMLLTDTLRRLKVTKNMKRTTKEPGREENYYYSSAIFFCSKLITFEKTDSVRENYTQCKDQLINTIIAFKKRY